MTPQEAIEILEQHQLWRKNLRLMPQHPRLVFEALEMAIGAMKATQWQPIKTCPKDNTWFLALIERIPYKCKAFMNGDVVNYHWCMHTNMASGQVLRIERNDDGTERKIQIREADEPRYEPRVLGYKSGMNHVPSHWMLYTPPTEAEEK